MSSADYHYPGDHENNMSPKNPALEPNAQYLQSLKFTEGAGTYPSYRWPSSLGMHMTLTARERWGKGFVKCKLNTQFQNMS